LGRTAPSSSEKVLFTRRWTNPAGFRASAIALPSRFGGQV
jgi:hypothetical protein